MAFTVFITRSFPPEDMRDLMKAKESGKIIVKAWESENVCPRNTLLEGVAGVHGILCTISDRVDKEVLDAAGSQLKVISTVSADAIHIDVAECKKRNIEVHCTPDMTADSAAEFAVTLILLVARRLLEGMQAVVDGEWGLWKPMWICGFEMGDRTLGIYGFGRVAFGIARRLKPFNVKRVIYYDLSEKEFARSVGATLVDFDTLVKESDILCICCAATPSTIKAFNKDVFAKMKEGSILINTSRGVIVDHDDLDKALKAGKPMACGLDVTDPEPLPVSHPLMSNPQCTITPHMATATWETRKNMFREASSNLRIILLGREDGMINY